MGTWIKVAAVAVVSAIAASVFVAWRDAQKEQAALRQELQATKQILADATARQTERDATLNSLLVNLKQQKAAIQKPAQVVQALPTVLHLPAPVTLEGKQAGTSVLGAAVPNSMLDSPTPKVDFPAVDLKPLYDFAVNCKACQAQLDAAQADLRDERVKEQALSRERDDALRVARGGSVLRRVAREAKSFAIGAAVGAAAAKFAR